jgi:hypothetical protein
MKKYFFIILVLAKQFSLAQDCKRCPSQSVMNNTDLIFEGRILSDSVYFQRVPGRIYTYHKVLVLKQFKGNFKSDTLRVVTWGGKMVINGMSEGTPGAQLLRVYHLLLLSLLAHLAY